MSDRIEGMSSAYARVQVTLEISVGSNWGQDCSLSQIYKQAKDDADGIVRRMIATPDLRVRGVIGALVVTAVMASERKP